MSSLEDRIKKFRHDNEELKKRVEAYKASPNPILIDEKDVLSGLASALVAGASLLSPGWLPKVLILGGKLLESMAQRKEKNVK